MKILIVTPAFFGYENVIADAFRSAGHDVQLRDERPSNSAVARAAVRAAPLLMRSAVRRHFARLTRELDDTSYDMLLVIKGEVVTRRFIEAFRAQNPHGLVVYYAFDSLANSPKARENLDLFDFRYTFDRTDSDNEIDFRYKPLFYSDEYTPGSNERDLDVSFVGTLHGDRYAFTQAIAQGVPDERRELYYFVAASWFFWVRKLTSRDVWPVHRRAISTTSLSRAQVVELMQRSRAVIDVQREGQAGLTMRTFEVLATGAALITTNSAVMREEFYDPGQILVVSRELAMIDPRVVSDFVQSLPTTPSVPKGFDAYSVRNWVVEFLELPTKKVSAR